MKKLVLGVLLAAAVSATGCVSDGSTVTMTWDFTHLADNSARSCPTNFDTVRVIAQPTDPTSHLGAGRTFVDKFDCADGEGRIKLSDNSYLVWLEVTNFSETSKYAQSQETFYDTLEGNVTIPVQILDDGGYFSLTWDLVDGPTNAPLSCTDVGIDRAGSVRVLTKLATSSAVITDNFDCTDHFGTTDGLLAGDYDITVEAFNNGILGLADPISKIITAPNGVSYLGNVLIPID
jgi:hypothetical protein